jgi:nucleoside-diphosphate-sugar epimerase
MAPQFASRQKPIMETVFVTGGSSPLGQHVLQRLMSAMRIIALVHRRKIELRGAEIELLPGGLEEVVRNSAALHKAQVVLHMAAVTHADNPSDYFRVNAELTKQLLSICSPSQHFVYVSTICAHPSGGAYGYSKWLAEEAVRNSGLDHTIIRPSEIYGSSGGEGIDALIALAQKKRILPDFRYRGSIEYAPISAQDTAHFIAETTISRQHTGKIYTLCANRSCTAADMARALRNSVRPLFVLPVPVTVVRLAKRLGLPLPFKSDQLDRLVLPKIYDNALARRDYDFQPLSFLDYLAGTQKSPHAQALDH